jgi:hypothetical protein
MSQRAWHDRVMIEQLFEHAGPDVLIGEIESTHREESMLMARRMGSIADLLALRTDEAEAADPDPGYAMITGFARTCAEVGAAMNMAPMTASRLVSQAEALDCRLPKIRELLADGEIDWRTTQLIITRTELVSDALIGQVDESLAGASVSGSAGRVDASSTRSTASCAAWTPKRPRSGARGPMVIATSALPPSPTGRLWSVDASRRLRPRRLTGGSRSWRCRCAPRIRAPSISVAPTR